MPEARIDAVGDGVANDTKAVQEAIDSVHRAGGGRVTVPGGHVVRSGSFHLRSGVELHLEAGSRLLASPDPADYTGDHHAAGWDAERHTMAMVCADDSEDIAITGTGIIDGNGRAYIEQDRGTIYRMKPRRPYAVFLVGVRGLTLREVKIVDGASWTVRLTGCQDVSISGLRILNDLKTPNSDGIDLDRCQNVRVFGCHIEAGDDCVVLKTMRGYERFGATENVVVSGCTLVSTSSALCVGCETAAPIRNALFDSCIIQRSHRGLSVNVSYENPVENIVFSNMIVETRLFDDAWWGRGEPVVVKTLPWTDRDQAGQIRNVVFRNITAHSENGVYVESEHPDQIDGLRFENVHVTLAKTSRWSGGRVDRRPCSGSEIRPQPTSGFMVQKASDVTLRDCSVRWEGIVPEYFAHALDADDVQNLTLDGFEGTSAFPHRLAARYVRGTSVKVVR